jgi:hypothetical protein
MKASVESEPGLVRSVPNLYLVNINVRFQPTSIKFAGVTASPERHPFQYYLH